MKGDFTRDTFDPLKHFSRVLMQQGRVTLDADFNEQTAILLRYVRKLARDIIGPAAAPAIRDTAGNDLSGFRLGQLNTSTGDFSISAGCYYVDGILVENQKACTYMSQPDYSKDDAAKINPPAFVYLDVWERHVTSIEDDSIREKALDGPDTCTRAKIAWQVKPAPFNESDWSKARQEVADQTKKLFEWRKDWEKNLEEETDPIKKASLFAQIQALDDQLRLAPLRLHHFLLQNLTTISKAKLAARVDPGLKIEDPCVTPPASKYRGAENQLYRVEIHKGGKAGESTFKWSRDNGSVVTAWLGMNGTDLQVTSARGFAAGNWVELLDDDAELRGTPGTFVKLAKVEADMLSVEQGTTLPARSDDSKHSKVRRWDQMATEAVTLVDGGISITEDGWIDLEDGIQIKFSADKQDGEYRTGDYWLIPARVATGNVEWPVEDNLPQSLPPHGIEHHYAVLGLVTGSGEKNSLLDFRCEFPPLLSCVHERIGSPHKIVAVKPTSDLPESEAEPAAPQKPSKRRKPAGSSTGAASTTEQPK
jgi:hypothetical protein